RSATGSGKGLSVPVSRRARCVRSGDDRGMSILAWLGLGGAPDAAAVEGVAAIERIFEGVDRGRARFLACFAFILTRAARADGHVADDEAEAMTRAVVEHGGIPPEQAALVVRI